jgi:type I restriction enzyme M protein
MTIFLVGTTGQSHKQSDFGKLFLAKSKGIFMIDAGKGFMKDGNKNRLREMDIHKIVDVFNKQTESEGYSRIVSFSEIEKNEFNLNIPRYIDSSEPEDLQDIEAHLLGDIPQADIDALHAYWDVCPNLKAALFTEAKRSPNYLSLKVSKDTIKQTIFEHPEFVSYMADMNQVFSQWEANTTATLKALQTGFHPKEIIHPISEALLATYQGRALIDKYDVYQHLMNYWFEVMQDDCYLIAADGWKATTYRIVEEKKNKDGQVTKTIYKGWACDLIPKALVIHRYFAEQQQAIDQLNAELETLQNQKTEMEEEQGGNADEGGAFAELDKLNKGSITARLKEINNDAAFSEEAKLLKQYLQLLEQEAATKKAIHAAEMELDAKLLVFYPTLTEEQIKQLVVDDKWMATIDKDIHTEMDRISQCLAQRIKGLAERYETPLPQQNQQVTELEKVVNTHLHKMGFVWN